MLEPAVRRMSVNFLLTSTFSYRQSQAKADGVTIQTNLVEAFPNNGKFAYVACVVKITEGEHAGNTHEYVKDDKSS